MSTGRAISTGRAAIPGCNRFTEQEIRVIRSRYDREDRPVDIAMAYDCSASYIVLIGQRKVWKHSEE